MRAQISTPSSCWQQSFSSSIDNQKLSIQTAVNAKRRAVRRVRPRTSVFNHVQPWTLLVELGESSRTLIVFHDCVPIHAEAIAAQSGTTETLVKMKKWWSQTESNRRPLACHASALPTELWPLTVSSSLDRTEKPPANIVAADEAARRPGAGN